MKRNCYLILFTFLFFLASCSCRYESGEGKYEFNFANEISSYIDHIKSYGLGWIGLAMIIGLIANLYKENKWYWFLGGLIFGPFTLLILFLFSDLTKLESNKEKEILKDEEEKEKKEEEKKEILS